MSAVDKLITRIEELAERQAEYRQTNDQLRTRIRVLEGALLEAKSERDKALADVQNWRQARQDAHEAGELLQAEIASLRQQLAEAQAEIKTLKGAMEMADEMVSLRQQLAKAQQQDVDAMRAECERLLAFVGKVRNAMWPEDLKAALAELDGQPAPVAETAEGGA